jgi:hypothetical protein
VAIALTRRSFSSALEANRQNALDIASQVGNRKLLKLLQRAEKDLTRRLRIAGGLRGGKETFTTAHLRATLEQVQSVTRDLVRSMGGVLGEAGAQAARAGAKDTISHLTAMDKQFPGVGQSPLALPEAAMLDEAVAGSRASLLRRIAGQPGHKGKRGILQRYGIETVKHFERRLQVGLLTGQSWGEMREALEEESPFLKGAPRSWGERIVRTEVMGAYGKAAHHAAKRANDDLGDVVKIWSEVDDDRTGADSHLMHGMVRHVDEDFDTPFGPVPAPPARPNDRAILVTHRVSWPLPPTLQQRPVQRALMAWKMAGNRKKMPFARPDPFSTVDLELFGEKQSRKLPR